MNEDFSNVYDDDARARAYATLEFPGTYYLAYRDIPTIINKHVTGRTALDFGCGAGRSTRFCRKLGFSTIGVDISPQMLAQARKLDPDGDYRLASETSLDCLNGESFDLVFSGFTFDNIPSRRQKVTTLKALRKRLNPHGRIINLVSSPDIYVNEWASFSTKDYPQNKSAKSGDSVFIVMLDVDDRRPVEDILWTHQSYQEVYNESDLQVDAVYRPLGQPSDPCQWVTEDRVAPWVIYVLASATQ